MFKKLISRFVSDPNKKVIDNMRPVVDDVAELEAEIEALSDDQLRERTARLRQHVAAAMASYDDRDSDEAHAALELALDDVLPEAFALVREASRRTTGLRHYDVQIMGGALLHRGEIVEMRTGEGKTLVATLPLFLNALAGRGVHLVTVNEYLVRRDGGWMGKIFHFLGLTVGCIGPQQFSALYDPEYVNPGAELEDDRLVHWRPCTRRDAYRADITYGTSSEFGFDYLRDNMVLDETRLVQRERHFAVIDEVDNVLIDEARTPLIISGPANKASNEYQRFAKLIRGLRRNTVEDEDAEPDGHYDLDEKSRSITLTDMGTAEVERRIEEIDDEAGESLYDPQFYELTYYLENALKAQYMFKKDVDYTVQGQEVIIIDDFTGRLMPGRRYSDGLHEAIEAKENVQVKRESVTIATITIQNYFRLYDKLGGMTGTAMTDAEEFLEIYDVEVTPLPTNVTYIAEYTDAGLIERKSKIENAERISYFEPNAESARFFKRVDFPDQVYATEDYKDQAIVAEIKRVADSGQPVLVGTTSVEHSEKIHRMLKSEKVDHFVLNAKMHESEALVVAQAGRRGAVTISTNMAGRGTDILLGGNPEGLAAEMVEKRLFDRPALQQLASTLIGEGDDKARQAAARHSKLSPELVDKLLAVKATFDEAAARIEKAQVAGYVAQELQHEYQIDFNDALRVVQFVQQRRLNAARQSLKDQGLDTIMVDEAVRLFDLHTQYQMALQDNQKMAQFLSEQVFDEHYTARAAIVRAVLEGEQDQAAEIMATVPALPETLISDIQAIMDDADAERAKVWDLGGLHVVGSERHESRRIDNQLRGRAARQGDPGSSRFFLSLEDDLMRRFGGERLRRFMASSVPSDMPIENGVLDRIIASSQERIEGYNFDIRKNVLEYDDVMARQREATYDERREILTGELDSEEKIDAAFELVIDELVGNYLDDYVGYVSGEIERAISDFSAEATGYVNVNGVLRRMQRLLPVQRLDAADFEEASGDQLSQALVQLARENEAEGRNLYQLFQAMRRFIPLIPATPKLATILAGRRSNHLQVRSTVQTQFVQALRDIFDSFLARYIEEVEREEIWERATSRVDEAFTQFSVQRVTREALNGQQLRFNESINGAVQDLLLESLETLSSDQLVTALNKHIEKQRQIWLDRIGEEEYERFKRLMLLDAIDKEWRDYLTAADDLRREIGLEAATRQKDPKIEYKMRSYEMFEDMRNNIQRDIADRFFREIARHEDFKRRQAAAEAQQMRLQRAGYQVVRREQGQGTELRREAPKVGRNDPCPCGSGKKYKNCHGRSNRQAEPVGAAVNATSQPSKPVSGATGRKKKKKKRGR